MARSTKCDCGQPGVRRDGGGYACQECDKFVYRITRLITKLIAAQRGGEFLENRSERTRQEHQWKYEMQKYGN